MKLNLFILISCLFMLTIQAQELDKKIEPILEAKADILEKIKNLKENEAILLPAPTIVENLGDLYKGWHQMKKFGPNGRDYSIKMAWMPDRKRAFFCGANHGSPHRFNDAWEYDLAANTWVLLYVPDLNDTGEFAKQARAEKNFILKDGFLTTKKGGPGHPSHTWWGLTYDANTKKIIWYCAWPLEYGFQAKLDAIGVKKEDTFKGPPIWVFTFNPNQWEPLKTEQPWPHASKFGSSLEYVEDLKKPILQYSDTSAILDVENRTWKITTQKGSSLPIETLVYFDTKRKLFVAHRGNRPEKSEKQEGKPEPKITTWVAKLEGEQILPWEVVSETEEDAPIGHDATSTMYYDPLSTDGLCFENKTKTIWRFNIDAKKWVKLEPIGENLKPDAPGKLVSYFDIARNVYVVIGSGWVWCYRYKK